MQCDAATVNSGVNYNDVKYYRHKSRSKRPEVSALMGLALVDSLIIVCRQLDDLNESRTKLFAYAPRRYIVRVARNDERGVTERFCVLHQRFTRYERIAAASVRFINVVSNMPRIQTDIVVQRGFILKPISNADRAYRDMCRSLDNCKVISWGTKRHEIGCGGLPKAQING
jgi:hypothetical protein